MGFLGAEQQRQLFGAAKALPALSCLAAHPVVARPCPLYESMRACVHARTFRCVRARQEEQRRGKHGKWEPRRQRRTGGWI